MEIAIGSDERTSLTDFLVEKLRKRGLALRLYGALAEGGGQAHWPDVGQAVAEAVASGRCQQGLLLCWTGTGVSIAANKVPGARAALCTDAATAAGARRWNDANILAMSLRLTSPEGALEMLDAWLSAPPPSGEDAELAERVGAIERKYSREGLPAPSKRG